MLTMLVNVRPDGNTCSIPTPRTMPRNSKTRPACFYLTPQCQPLDPEPQTLNPESLRARAPGRGGFLKQKHGITTLFGGCRH